MKAEYDVVVVGAGHNSLITAAYLARVGLSVGVFERNPWIGGGVVTREVTAPGFFHDTHSVTHGLIQANPLIRDDELELKSRFGLEYIRQKTVYGSIFPESGTTLITHDDIEKTVASISAISPRDGEAYRRFMAQAEAIAPLLTTGLFNPPLPFGTFMATLYQSAEGRDLARDMMRSAFDIVMESFENDYVRMHLLKWAGELMIGPEEQGTGVVLFLMFAISHLYWPSMPKGGSGALAKALRRCLEHHGGEIETDCDVQSALIEGGRASGVTLTDGRTIRARRGVVASIHPNGLDAFVGGALPERLKRLTKSVKSSSYSSLLSHYALKRAPRFKGSSNIGEGYIVGVLPERLEDFRRTYDEYRYGHVPDQLKIMALIQSNWDPSRAPDGQATLWLYHLMPYDLAKGGAVEWDRIKDAVADRLLAQFRSIADGAEPDDILARCVESPLDYERSNTSFHRGDIVGAGGFLYQFGGNRPIPELSGYSVPGIEGLYLVGPFMHPGGGVIGGGRPAAIKIFSDWELDWEMAVSPTSANRCIREARR